MNVYSPKTGHVIGNLTHPRCGLACSMTLASRSAAWFWGKPQPSPILKNQPSEGSRNEDHPQFWVVICDPSLDHAFTEFI